MKLNTIILYSLVLILSSSCATLNVSEVRSLEKTNFDSLCLVPDNETNDLRIDLIRQTYEKNVNDSTKEKKETPYHPIGFNLGNGLFYDLNENLCLRIDYLLDFSTNENFELQKTNDPERNKGILIFKFKNDSLFVQYPPRKKQHYRYHQIDYPDSVSYMYKNRLKYAITETDSSLVYSGKKRKWDVVHKIDENNFYINKKKWKENYQIKDNSIFLENDYIVSLINDGSTIEIKRKRKGRVLYTIERNSEKLFIYDKNYHGLRIELQENSILIYRNKTLIRKYEIKSGTSFSHKTFE